MHEDYRPFDFLIIEVKATLVYILFIYTFQSFTYVHMYKYPKVLIHLEQLNRMNERLVAKNVRSWLLHFGFKSISSAVPSVWNEY